jgi:hypothetical protein
VARIAWRGRGLFGDREEGLAFKKEEMSMDVNKGAAGLVVVAIIMAVVWGGLSAYVGVNPFFLPTGAH